MKLVAPIIWGGWELTDITVDGTRIFAEGTVAGQRDSCEFQTWTPSGKELVSLLEQFGENMVFKTKAEHDYKSAALF